MGEVFAILGDRAGMILSPTAVQKSGEDFTNKPVGSGPMKLDNWAVGASQKLSKFAQYRKSGYPYLDGIDVQIVPNSSVQFANLRSGNTDLIMLGQKDVDAAKKFTDRNHIVFGGRSGFERVLDLIEPAATGLLAHLRREYRL